jgi:dTDP-4-dehydrorhamnose reductase
VRLLLTGSSGQVGCALLETLPRLGEVIAPGRRELDLSKSDSIVKAVARVGANVIVNAGAYTAVDQAEKEEPLAMAVNRDGPAVLAQEAARCGALLVHFSTDYVFDGEKAAPYVEADATNPLNAYGRSKLAGEQAIRRSGCRHLIFRTSWVYSNTGKNFLLTMLRLAREKKELRVVDDQHGAPTSSRSLADAVPPAIAAVLRDASLGGLYHMSAQGSTTWCGFARAIVGDRVSVVPIRSSEYPMPARRPRNSVLDNMKLEQGFGIRLPSWEASLRDVLARVRIQP